MNELEPLVQDDWRGELQYRNYSDDQLFTIRVNLMVEKQSDRKFKFNFSYPDEPNANGTSSLSVSKDGMKIGKESVLEVGINEDGSYEITTGYWGKDNRQKMYIIQTYTIGDSKLEIAKSVSKTEGTKGHFRNKYTFVR